MPRIRRITVGFALVLGTLALALPAQGSYPGDCLGYQTKYSLTSGNDYRDYTGSGGQCVDALGGDDTIYLGDNNDQAYGDGGYDHIEGGPDSDIIYGGATGDLLYGGAKADYLDGDDGDDVFYDGTNPDGNGDVIIGGPGFDTLYHCTGAGSGQADDYISGDVLVYSDHLYC